MGLSEPPLLAVCLFVARRHNYLVRTLSTKIVPRASLVNQKFLVRQNADVEYFPPRGLRRRWQFFIRYLLAQMRAKGIAKLLPTLKSSFDHPWVAGIELKIRFWPGNETSLGRLWRLYKSLPAQSMHWDAPITVSVFRERRGKKRQALCMSFYLVKDILYIAQIQGVHGTDAPKELRAWPTIFIDACQTFARRENLREVRIARAESLYSYRDPYLGADLLPEAREHALKRIRKNMKPLYDTNATDLGFVSDGAWYKWRNFRDDRMNRTINEPRFVASQPA
jgi:hypothetical protein